jgi:FemAB-related protein (PEP-CTERM system-associated)
MTLDIGDLTPALEAEWDGFVRAMPEASFFHQAGWRRVIARGVGHATYFRIARRAGAVMGVLPLVHVRSRLFGNALISTGFGTYGGILAADAETAGTLADDAAALGRKLGVDYVELRHTAPQPIGWPAKADLYVRFQRPLSPDAAENLAALPDGKRSDLRRAVKGGLRLEPGAGLDRFYAIYAASVRNLGTPVYPRRFFAAIAEEFPEAVEILAVHGPDGPVAATLSLSFGGAVSPYFAGGLTQARGLHAYDYLYWSLMERGARRGAARFDFGRSKRGTGAFDYKLHWGFEPEPLAYQFHLVRRRDLPNVNPLNPKYRLMVETWKRLPLPVANRLGPLIARQLG